MLFYQRAHVLIKTSQPSHRLHPSADDVQGIGGRLSKDAGAGTTEPKFSWDAQARGIPSSTWASRHPQF